MSLNTSFMTAVLWVYVNYWRTLADSECVNLLCVYEKFEYHVNNWSMTVTVSVWQHSFVSFLIQSLSIILVILGILIGNHQATLNLITFVMTGWRMARAIWTTSRSVRNKHSKLCSMYVCMCVFVCVCVCVFHFPSEIDLFLYRPTLLHAIPHDSLRH